MVQSLTQSSASGFSLAFDIHSLAAPYLVPEQSNGVLVVTKRKPLGIPEIKTALALQQKPALFLGEHSVLDFKDFDVPDSFGGLDADLFAFFLTDQGLPQRRCDRNGARLDIGLVWSGQLIGSDFSGFKVFHDDGAAEGDAAVVVIGRIDDLTEAQFLGQVIDPGLDQPCFSLAASYSAFSEMSP